MRLPVIRAAGLTVVLAVGLALSACSSQPAGSKPAAQLVPEVQAAGLSATSVHVAGSVQQGNDRTTIDVGIDGNSVAGYLGPMAHASTCCR